jgi:hypothetical protein
MTRGRLSMHLMTNSKKTMAEQIAEAATRFSSNGRDISQNR